MSRVRGWSLETAAKKCNIATLLQHCYLLHFQHTSKSSAMSQLKRVLRVADIFDNCFNLLCLAWSRPLKVLSKSLKTDLLGIS